MGELTQLLIALGSSLVVLVIGRMLWLQVGPWLAAERQVASAIERASSTSCPTALAEPGYRPHAVVPDSVGDRSYRSGGSPMLMLTDTARKAIESVVANAEMPSGSGLRIDAPDEPPAPTASGAPLQLEVAREPAEHDQVVSEGDAKVFVSSKVAPLLNDKLLDVRVTEGRMQFVIAPQPGQAGQGPNGQSDPAAQS